jgi:hypothetical protein
VNSVRELGPIPQRGLVGAVEEIEQVQPAERAALPIAGLPPTHTHSLSLSLSFSLREIDE